MIDITIVIDDEKDKELFYKIETKFPVFINFVDSNSLQGRKEAYRIKSPWAAKANPFVIVTTKDKVLKVFYSDAKGDNAIYQLIKWLNESTSN